MNLRKNNAITLVVLVITVIVMLILAGVAISQINGDGIIDKSSKIKIENNKKQLEERLELAKQRAEAYDKPIIECLDKKDLEIEDLGSGIIVAKIDNDSFLVEDYNTVTYLENGFEVWKGPSNVAESFDSGKGTEDDPYIIRTASQLAYLAKRVNEGESFEGKYFRQVAPICLGAKSNGTTWSGPIWIPIGYAEENPFSGTYDGGIYDDEGTYVGQNNKIIGLYSEGDGTKKELSNIGLFGINTGNIKNLDMSGNYILPTKIPGGMIVAYNKGGIIENCINRSMCKAGVYGTIGAICGKNEDGIIRNCRNEVKLQSASGIVAVNTGTVEHCYNTGEINGGGYAAGIVGANEGGTVQDCYNLGKIINGCGIAKYNKNAGTVTRCYNKGYIYGPEGGTQNQHAGIVGNNSGIIEKCYNAGIVEVANYYIGGICGNNGGKIKDCYNKAKVDASGVVGSISGLGTAGTNCYNIGEVVDRGKGTSDKKYYIYTDVRKEVTLSELQSKAILTILNSEGENVWRIDPAKNNGMPILDWQ